MSFDQAAVNSLMDKVVSHALSLGLFESVNSHEPKAAPGNGINCAVWVDTISPVKTSGMAATSGKVTLNVRMYLDFLSKPEDQIDPQLLTATTTLLNAYTGDLDLGQTVRAIDLIGMEGTPMSAKAGYVNIDNHLYRAYTITLPVIINDLWTQGA